MRAPANSRRGSTPPADVTAMKSPPSRTHATARPVSSEPDDVDRDVDVRDGLLDGDRRVVDRFVRSQLRKKGVLARARGPDHVRAACLCDLHREMPDAARRTEHEHAIARLDVRRLDERLPRGEPGQRQRRRLHVAQRVGRSRELA